MGGPKEPEGDPGFLGVGHERDWPGGSLDWECGKYCGEILEESGGVD